MALASCDPSMRKIDGGRPTTEGWQPPKEEVAVEVGDHRESHRLREKRGRCRRREEKVVVGAGRKGEDGYDEAKKRGRWRRRWGREDGGRRLGQSGRRQRRRSRREIPTMSPLRKTLLPPPVADGEEDGAAGG